MPVHRIYVSLFVVVLAAQFAIIAAEYQKPMHAELQRIAMSVSEGHGLSNGGKPV
jgi:hypothetical protein